MRPNAHPKPIGTQWVDRRRSAEIDPLDRADLSRADRLAESAAVGRYPLFIDSSGSLRTNGACAGGATI
jgi:hypothetical protein